MSLGGFRYPDKPVETGPDVVQALHEPDWIAQAKYDGWRMPTYVHGPGNVQCLSSVGNPMSSTASQFSDNITEQIRSMELPPSSVIDAEFVGPRGHLDPAVYIFDVLAWEGEWLVREPYERRWERCKGFELPSGGLIHLAETVEEGFVSFFRGLEAGWDGHSIYLYEGIVIKARHGGMKLDRNGHKKSDVMFKWKFRNNRERRWQLAHH